MLVKNSKEGKEKMSGFQKQGLNETTKEERTGKPGANQQTANHFTTLSTLGMIVNCT